MALTSASTRADALAQFRNSLRYWEAASTAGDLVEAIAYLLQGDPQNMSIAGRSYTRETLQTLMDRALPYAESGGAGKMRFARGRVLNMGRRA